jgi:hypothetical protein
MRSQRERVRKVAPVQSKRAAEQYERELRAELLMGSSKVEKEVVEEAPRFEAFSAEFLSTYAKNNNKPSEVQSKESILGCILCLHSAKCASMQLGPERSKPTRPESSRRVLHRNP